MCRCGMAAPHGALSRAVFIMTPDVTEDIMGSLRNIGAGKETCLKAVLWRLEPLQQ